MSKFDDIAREARALSPKEKAALARVLIDDLDPTSDASVEQLWLEEAQRRYDAYCRGEMDAATGEESMARARKRLR